MAEKNPYECLIMARPKDSGRPNLLSPVSAQMQTVKWTLQWWKMRKHERTFPRVSRLAKHYLCISATSTPSERVFSTGSNIGTCHETALKPEAVDRLVILACNLKKDNVWSKTWIVLRGHTGNVLCLFSSLQI